MEIYKKLEDEYGETVLYAPKFDLETAALWLCPLLVAGAAAGVWAYNKHKKKTNVHIMALNLIRGVPLTPKKGKPCLISLHHLHHKIQKLPSGGGDGEDNDLILYRLSGFRSIPASS